MHYDTPFERFYFNCMREIVYLLKYMPLCLKLATHYWFVCTPVWVVSSAPLILHREETKIQLWILFAFKWGFLGRLEREGEKIIDQSSLFFLHLPISCPSLPPVCLPLLNDLWIFGKTGRTIISPWMCHVFSISHCCYYAMLVIYQQSNHFLLLIFVFILHAIKKKHDSLSLSLSLQTSASRLTGKPALQPCFQQHGLLHAPAQSSSQPCGQHLSQTADYSVARWPWAQFTFPDSEILLQQLRQSTVWLQAQPGGHTKERGPPPRQRGEGQRKCEGEGQRDGYAEFCSFPGKQPGILCPTFHPFHPSMQSAHTS